MTQLAGARTTLDLLPAAHAWTGDRIAAVGARDLQRPTPCTDFDLGQLLDHLAGSIERFTVAVGGDPSPTEGAAQPANRFAGLSERNLEAWAHADLAAAFELPLGRIPAPIVAQLNLAEVVIHGWDVGRAMGEAADVPDELADTVLAFGHVFLTDDLRGRSFGPAQPAAPSASDQMIAFYGRRP